MQQRDRVRAVRRRLSGIEAIAVRRSAKKFGEGSAEARGLFILGRRTRAVDTLLLLGAAIVVVGSALSIVNFFRSPSATVPPAPDAVSAEATPTTSAEGPDLTVTPEPASDDVEHTVAPGDTLRQIASRYGVSMEAIADENGIQNIDRIEVGATLVIPEQDSRAGP